MDYFTIRQRDKCDLYNIASKRDCVAIKFTINKLLALERKEVHSTALTPVKVSKDITAKLPAVNVQGRRALIMIIINPFLTAFPEALLGKRYHLEL